MRLHTVIFQTKRSRTESTTFVLPHRASFDFEFSADEIPTPLSPAWLWSRHPLIAENWEQLKTRNLSEAKQWAKQQARKSLKERRVEILGLKCDGPQIAISGPTVIVFMLVYLGAYLIYLYEKTTTSGLTKDLVVLSPWIGGIARPWALFLTFLTLGLLPAFATLVTLWSLLEQRVIASIFSCSIALSVGALLWRFAYPLARFIEESKTVAPTAPPVVITTKASKKVK